MFWLIRTIVPIGIFLHYQGRNYVGTLGARAPTVLLLTKRISVKKCEEMWHQVIFEKAEISKWRLCIIQLRFVYTKTFKLLVRKMQINTDS